MDAFDPVVVDPVDLLIADIKYTHGDDFLSEEQEEFWRVILNRLAADVVNGVLPDDPSAQHAVIRKAQALGIDIEGEADGSPLSFGPGENVVDQFGAGHGIVLAIVGSARSWEAGNAAVKLCRPAAGACQDFGR